MALGKYLYGVIRCQRECIFPGLPAIGGLQSTVHTITHHGLAAVASDSAETRYETNRENLLLHQRVLERIMSDFPLLPVRFGTVAEAPTAVQDIENLLESQFREFDRLLSQMEGKVELGLKAFWRDEGAIYAEIVAEDASIRRLVLSLTRGPRIPNQYDRVRLGETVKSALDRKRAKEAARILSRLRWLAHQVRENDTLADRVVVNAAFLVDTKREPEFDQAVKQLDEELGQRIALKYVGPVPPYNFVNIVVNWEQLRQEAIRGPHS